MAHLCLGDRGGANSRRNVTQTVQLRCSIIYFFSAIIQLLFVHHDSSPVHGWMTYSWSTLNPLNYINSPGCITRTKAQQLC